MWRSWFGNKLKSRGSKSEAPRADVRSQAKIDPNIVPFRNIDIILAMHIPVLIPCFNNLTYVQLMVSQLRRFGVNNIVILDNGSSYPPMIEYLSRISHEVAVVSDKENYGPHHFFNDDATFDALPELFCVTDPDLLFNDGLPRDFIAKLIKISKDHRAGKVGMALDISEPHLMLKRKFDILNRKYGICEWEKQFWLKPISKTEHGDIIYDANIDTTFALYNKKYFDRTDFSRALRVAGNYTCKHLPWYINNLLPQDESEWYRKRAKHSFYLSEGGVAGHNTDDSDEHSET